MSVTNGPNLPSKDIIVHLDASNAKSFRGEPTVNYISNPLLEKTGGEFDQYHNLAPIFDTYGLTPYSLSMDIKVNKNGPVLVYMQNGSYSKYGFVSQWVNVTTEYQRFKFENLTPVFSTSWQQNTPNDNRAMLATYTTYGSTVYPTVRNVQVEPKTYATPFVSGTRGGSVTTGGGLIDLTGNYIHGELVNSPRYSSTNGGSILFDGTNDHISINYSGVFAGASFSTWLKTSNASSYMFIAVKGGLTANPGTQNGIAIFTPDWAASTVQVYLNDATGISKTSMSANIGQTVRDGRWHNIVVTYNYDGTNSTLISYLDGEPKATGSLNQDRTNFFNYTEAYWLGGRSDIGGYFNGNIASHTIYNRSLSANEVQRNFNAFRGRFGI